MQGYIIPMKKSIWNEKQLLLRVKLKKIRKSAKLTQKELAEKLNKPQSYISKYENGERWLDFIEVLEICEECGE